MLRSTGFFRGLDCPFYSEHSDGCNRPYCHFRHSQQRRPSYGAPAYGKSRDRRAGQKDQCYDPFNPEVTRPEGQQDGNDKDSGDITGALELVNKAIEEVRSQVEREKRKLSQIGDEEYNPNEAPGLSKANVAKSKAAGSHLAYDPGSYQISSEGFKPGPGCSKYTLDSNNQTHNINSMEYVPTSLKKPPVPTQVLQASFSPPNSKYKNNTSSSQCKYTLDNSRPPTDMEYDPLSNFSAGIAAKGKRDVVAQPAKTDYKNELELPGTDLTDEGYFIDGKKPDQPSVDTKKYTISDSDGESSGTEYRPTSLTALQQKRSSLMFGRELVSKVLGVHLLGKKNESTIDVEMSEYERNKISLQEKKMSERSGRDGSVKRENVQKIDREVNKVSKSNSTDGILAKSSSKDSAKSQTKINKSRDDKKNKSKDKTVDKVQREGREDKRSDGKVQTLGKTKRSKSKEEQNAKDSKKLKTAHKEKDQGLNKHKINPHKNGKLDSVKRDKDLKKKGKSSSSSCKRSSSVGDRKVKQLVSSLNGKEKKQNKALSHVDLFGDESPDEVEPLQVDNDDDEEADEVLIQKSVDAIKQVRLNKRKASEWTSSSSDGESDRDVECKKKSSGKTSEDEVDLSCLQDILDFDSDPMEECLRIFNESKDVKREDKGRQAKQSNRDSEEDKSTDSTFTTLFPGQKKRVSHLVAKGKTEKPVKTLVRPYRRPTPQEMCYQRMQLAQQQAAQLSASVRVTSHNSTVGLPGEKKRIAHRPNPQMSSPKTSPAEMKPAASQVLAPGQTSQSVRAQTTAGIMSKTSTTVMHKRVAHTPTMKSSSLKRPVIPSEFGTKVPTNIRQRYLNTFIDECLKFCPSEEEAFQMALDEEKVVYDRSSSKNIYLNVAVNTLKKLRGKSSSTPSPATKGSNFPAKRRPQSHEEVLGGRLAATTSFTVNRSGKQQEEKLTGATLYRKLKAYLMTEEQLQEHGYPRANPDTPGKAVIHNAPEKKAVTDPFTKICCRCGAEYKVNINGNCVRREECSYHWGRLRRHKVSGGWETSYSCCTAGVGTPGCQMSKQHVQDGRKESLDGFVSTFSKSLSPDKDGGVFALDCEMCYTKQGLELTRVTVIDSEMKVIYDTFVKPESKVVDYNTRFSGVTEEDLENTTITLRDVQAVLLCMFSSESILIGHSLESDLLALKLIHSSVVDTSVVFPHRLGLPYKRALRNLMADHLKRIIQDNVEGHDSSEDASACMELMIWKIKEDAKVKR